MANPTAIIQCTVNGQTKTIGEVVLADISSPASVAVIGAQGIAISLQYPIKVDAGTAINLVTVAGSQFDSDIASAVVHTISQPF